MCLPIFVKLCAVFLRDLQFLRVNERCEDSYVSLDNFSLSFFMKKSLVFFSHSNLMFRGLIFDFFSSFPLLKGRQTPVSWSKSVKVTKKT